MTDETLEVLPEETPDGVAATDAVEQALKEKLTPADRMNRAFTQFIADNPLFPATIKGNSSGHYMLGACGAQVTLNCNDKGNPLRCAPETIDEARKFIDDGISLLRETLTETVKHMVKILDLNLG